MIRTLFLSHSSLTIMARPGDVFQSYEHLQDFFCFAGGICICDGIFCLSFIFQTGRRLPVCWFWHLTSFLCDPILFLPRSFSYCLWSFQQNRVLREACLLTFLASYISKHFGLSLLYYVISDLLLRFLFVCMITVILRLMFIIFSPLFLTQNYFTWC